MSRRALVATALVVLVPVVVMAIEVQVARVRPRLDDEDGFRVQDLRVRSGPDPLDVVWLGDSTATGVGSNELDEPMAHRVTMAVGPDGSRLTILARSGDQVHEVLGHQLAALRRRVDGGQVPEIVFVSIGANDVTSLTRRPTFRRRYRDLVDELRAVAPDATLILVGIPDMGVAPRLPIPLRQVAGVRAAQLDADVAGVAADRGLHHVELAERTSREFSRDPDRYFSGDDFHPSGPGHGLWAGAIVASLREAGTVDVDG